MATHTEPAPRVPLSRDRVVHAAVELADASGIDAVSMRKLGQALGVEAMSLYNHVANKEEILDGMVDLIVGEIDLVDPSIDWMPATRRQILTARQIMLEHRWAPAVIETRVKISPALMRYFDNLLGLMREGGFSYDLAHHAMHVLGSRALGFNQELFEPDDAAAADVETEQMLRELADQLPYMVGMLAEITHQDPDSTIGWCDDQTEFEFGLDLILDGLEARRGAG